MFEPPASAISRLASLLKPLVPDHLAESFYVDYDCDVECAIFRAGNPLTPDCELHVDGALLTRESPERLAEQLRQAGFPRRCEAGIAMGFRAKTGGGFELRAVDSRGVTQW